MSKPTKRQATPQFWKNSYRSNTFPNAIILFSKTESAHYPDKFTEIINQLINVKTGAICEKVAMTRKYLDFQTQDHRRTINILKT